MDKLTVGVVVKQNYNKLLGGAFAYYETLIESIDKYEFDKRLEIKFIIIGPSGNSTFQKPLIHVNPAKYFNGKDKLNEFSYKSVRKIAQSARLLNGLQKKLEFIYKKSYNKSLEGVLVENGVDLLFYPTPANVHNLDFPFIITNWDSGHRSSFSFPEVAMNGTYEDREHYFRNTLGRAFAIFCESCFGRKELIQFTNINSDRVFVVPLFPGKVAGLSLSEEEQQKYLNDYSLLGRRYFFYPAQFWSHKNHYNLLIAFRKFIKIYPDIKLLFSGSDKGNLEYIKSIIDKLQLEKEVIITGFVPHEALYSFYKGAIALVMPTLLGPTNMPLLEAEQIGCPVICSDIEGHKEMMGDNAYYIKPDEPDSLLEGLLYHIKDTTKKAAKINPVFNVENTLKQIELSLLALKPIRKTFGFNFKQF